MGTYPSDNVSARFCCVSASRPLFPPPCVRAHGSSGPGLSPPPRWLVGDVAPFFFRGSQLCLLLLSHSRRLRSPLFSFWCVMRVAGHLAQRYWTVRVSRRAEKNQSPEPRYVCAVCRLHSTFSASPSSSASILTQHPTPERTISPRNCHNKTLHL